MAKLATSSDHAIVKFLVKIRRMKISVKKTKNPPKSFDYIKLKDFESHSKLRHPKIFSRSAELPDDIVILPPTVGWSTYKYTKDGSQIVQLHCQKAHIERPIKIWINMIGKNFGCINGPVIYELRRWRRLQFSEMILDWGTRKHYNNQCAHQISY